ncbi:hypothetical protein [Sanguibacter massiliensis]|uniref:hypothetical protein n=1 Tax=Sanguibacter massiliensis TaxID=1973217 RepID=UPI001A925749|nr:hypothetical protein [Sanguibacter massiliensis]
MTQHYAAITDDTLNRKAREFHEKQRIDKTRSATEPHDDAAVERMRAKFTAVLPDGKCLSPPVQGCDFRQNPCNTCSFYDPDEENFGETHMNHRRMLQLTVIQHQDDPARRAINQANLDALNHRVPEKP